MNTLFDCRIACLLLFLISGSQTLGAQIHYRDLAPFSGSGELAQVMEQSRNVLDSLETGGLRILRADILECGGLKYLLPDGLFDVFAWENERWQKKYTGKFHGYNHNSRKFCWNDKLYSFGGNGFWRQHGELTYFEPKTGEWEIVLLDGFDRSGNGLAFGLDSLIYVIQPMAYDMGFVESKKSYPSLRIDLANTSVRLFRHPRIQLEDYRNLNRRTFETDHYLYADSRPAYLIDKTNRKIFTSGIPFFPELAGVANHPDFFIHSVSDSLAIYDQSGHRLSTLVLNEQALSQWTPLKRNLSQAQKILVVSGSFLPIFSLLAFVAYRRRRKNGNRQEGVAFRHTCIPDLLNLTGNTIPAGELDRILGIDRIDNPEKLRYQRAILINEINLEMKTRNKQKLIHRIKDPLDKRRFLYRIGQAQ